MGRYSKTYSNYVLKGKHQDINGGTIWERDFSTIGERHNIAPGKRRYYFDGNMLFTVNNTSLLQNRQKPGTWLCSYTYPDVKDIVNDINNVKVNRKSNDISSFAYYGSALDLIRSSIENIIKEFPASIINQPDTFVETYTVDLRGYKVPEKILMNGKPLHSLFNPFEINIYDDDPSIEKYDNELRYLALNWSNYVVKVTKNNLSWIEPIKEYTVDGAYYTGCIWDESYQCISNVHITTVRPDGSDNFIELYVYLINDEYVICTDIDELFEIKPKEDVINDYFNSLDSFEALLLNRDTNPLYSNNFITPTQSNDGSYNYPLRTYTWPLITNSKYCIDITSNTYIEYLNNLIDLANILDEIKSDNIWRCMTHESIKYFDWTYTRDINEALEESFFYGGERIKSVLRLTGRVFDDVKRMIDGISFTNRITYNGFDNVSDAEISDKLELNGWDVLTTTWSGCDKNFDYYESETISNAFINGFIINSNGQQKPIIDKISPWIKGHGDNSIDNSSDIKIYLHDKWYSGLNYNSINKNSIDTEFMRRLYLSSRRILQSKGTEQSIEMILGMFGLERDVDYKMTGRYHTTKPIPYNKEYLYYEKMIFDPSKRYINKQTVPFNTDINPNENFISVINEINENEYYYLVKGEKACDILVDIMRNNMELHYYEDTPFPGVPLKKILIGNDEFVVPYFEKNKMYDGYPYFQSRGGWCKKTSDDKYNYTETVPYLNVVTDIESLLNQSGSDLSDNIIVYVNDLHDYLNYVPSIPDDISHFFKLVNSLNYDEFNAWKYIPMSGDITTIINYNRDGITHEDYLNAKHLDEIISTDFGNNPHCGYGNYDMGKEYIDYISHPLKHMVEHGTLQNSEYDAANSIRFKIEDHDTSDKIVLNSPDTYCLNDKTLIIENLIQNDIYKEYFINFISHYLLQVVPSTTILLFKNFNIDSNINKTVTINCISNNESWGTAQGGGTYNYGSTIIISAVPKSGYKFVEWVDENNEHISSITTLKLNVEEDKTFKAIFAIDIEIKVTCNPAQGSVSGGGLYSMGDIVEVRAIPNSSYKFKRWLLNGEELTNAGSIYRFKATKNESFVAEFETGQFTFTVDSGNCGDVNVYDGGYHPVPVVDFTTEVVNGLGGQIRISSNKTSSSNLVTTVNSGGGQIRVSTHK